MSRKPAIGIGITVAIAVLGLAAWASDSARTEKPAAVDAERYADFIENEVLDVQDLAEGAEIQRRFFNRITPPGLSWAQPMFPLAVPFDAANFDGSFLDGLLGEDRNSVAVYPLSLALDPKTRETLVYNAEGKLIAAMPADPFPRSWPEDADPARVTLQLDLLPSEDVEPYLYAESRIAEYATAESKKPAGMALRSLGGSEFGFAGIRRTNGAMRITATNGTDGTEIYSYTVLYTSSTVVATWTNDENEVVTDTNVVWTPVSPPYAGIESEWECRTTNLLFTNGAAVWEDMDVPSNALARFYAAAQPVDTDEDGLTDGAEIFLHRTDPGLADTDGDGMPDGWEVKYGLNARSGLDPSLACWWKLDDGEGTNALNSVADAHHGELRGFSGATNGGWTAEGMFGGALAFDGSDDWVRIAQDAAVLTGGPFTVSAWARLDGSCTSDWPEVVSDLMAGTYDGYCLGFGPDDKAYAMIGFSGWAQDTNALADQWVWLALEFDGTDMRLYRNGVLVQAPVPASHAPATNGFFSIGNGQDTAFSEHWKGLIDDVRIYRSAIGTNGLAAMYDAQEDPDGDGLSNIEESRHLANPHDADSDRDGLDDNEEVYVYGTDPMQIDTDGDGMPDGWEIGNGFNPNDVSDGSQDADGDGLTNVQEYLAGTDPFMVDSDGDGIADDVDATPASGHCTLGKELYYYLPPYYRQMDDGNTGQPVYAGTVHANPTGFVGNMVAITNITLIGAVDDCFKINGHEYAWGMMAKYFTANITAAVSDLQAGTFAVDIYDYITNTPNNQVALLFDFGYSLGARCIYQYDIDLAVNFPLPQDWVCWSPNGTYDARARLTTDPYTAGRVYWSITNVAGPSASIYSGGLVAYGSGGGRYRIKATSVDATNCFATMTLVVTKVDIQQTATNVCKDCGCSVTLNVTSNSYSPGGYVWSSSPAGISGSGPSITFSPSILPPGAYTVYAKSAAHPECYDICTVNVLKVETAFADPDDANWADLAEEKVILSDKDTRIKIKVTPQLADLQTIFYAIGTTVKIRSSGTAPNGQDFTMTSQNTTLVQGSGYSELRVALTRSQLISLGVLPSQENDSVTEKAWYDTGFDTAVSYPNLLDGRAFDNGMSAEIRGQCTQAIYGGLDSTPPNSPLDNSFFKAGGVEIITAECCSGVSDKRQLMNQADYFYYSGHGFIATGAVYPGGPSDVIDYWDKDLDVVIFAGCSVLDINDYNNNTNGAAHLASPGEQWEPTGPALFLGYNWKAPTDLQNSDGIISSWLSNRGSLGNIGAWEEANDNMNGHNACAIEAGSTYYYFEKTEILGVSFWDWTSVPKSSW